ncbi:MAG: FimV/HubP family polar landmark protein [Methylomonas sp.]
MGNLTKSLGFVMLAPATAWALSIGDIQVHSTLNQYLDAEIKLHVEAGEDPRDVTVRMAAPDKFDRAGVPWTYYLSKVKFETIVKNDNSVTIKLSSSETLTEPFLDVLLEVIGTNGSQFKEFPLLFDPPSSYDQPATAIADNGNRYQDHSITSYESPLRKSHPVSRGGYHSHPSQHPQVAAAAKESNPQIATNGEYGPTRTSENLWLIAKQLGNQQGVPAKEMLNALYRANPAAFIGNNINALKKGVTLKIPAIDGAKSAASANVNQAEQKQLSTSNKPLQLLSPSDGSAVDKAALGSQEKAGQSGNQSTVGDTNKAGDDKSLELQTRIEKLEQQLSLMQQLLALKDQQLSEVQKAGNSTASTSTGLLAATPPAAPAPVKIEPPPTVVSAPPQPAVVALPAAAPKPLPVVKTPPPVQTEDFFASDSYYVSLAGVSVAVFSVLGWLWWRKRSIDMLTSRESMFASADQIRIPDVDHSLSIPVLEIDNSAAFYDVGMVGESSFISDFTPSDFDAFDTEQNEVDPLSEADVYLAYGRYQQAEDLIRHAIKQEPEKDVYKLKLLEVFYAGENRQGFADYVQELAAKGKQADQIFWGKVTEMAKEIAADLPLFGGASGFAPQMRSAESNYASDPGTKQTSGHFDSLDFDAVPMDMQGANPTESMFKNIPVKDQDFSAGLNYVGGDSSKDHGLDFNIDKLADNSVKVDKINELASFEFDLSDLSFTDAVEPSPVDPQDELEKFEFDFDLETIKPYPEKVESNPVLGLKQQQDMHMEDNFFADDDFFAPDNGLTRHGAESADNNPGLTEFDFNFDFDMPVVDSKEYNGYELGASNLKDTNEFETKIDLAKACLDMGDSEAAKNIAEEVLSKGTTQQQTVAKNLLDKMR